MYTLSSKIFLVLQKDAPATQPPDAVKAATNSDIMSKISNLSSLSEAEKRKLAEYIKNNPIDPELARKIHEQYAEALSAQGGGKSLEAQQKAILDFISTNRDLLQQLSLDASGTSLDITAPMTSQGAESVEKPTFSDEIKKATDVYKSDLEKAKGQIEQILKSPIIASFNIQKNPLYIQYNEQYESLISSLSKLQNSSKNINQATLFSLQDEVKRFKEDTEVIKKKYGGYNEDIQAIASFIETQSNTYISALDTEIERFGTTTKTVTQAQPEKTRGMAQTTQSNNTETTGKVPEEAQKEIKKYHANFKTMWREFNEILDPTLRKNPEKGFTETYKKAKAQYYALEKKLSRAQDTTQVQGIMPEVVIFVALLRQFETKDTRVKSILDTFEEQSNAVNISLNSKNTNINPLQPKAPNSTETTDSSIESLQKNYLQRIEAGITDIINEMKEQGEGNNNQYTALFNLMQLGADVGLSEEYISNENAERLKPYKATLEGIIGEMYLDILKEEGFKYTFTRDDKGVRKIQFSHKNKESAEKMTKLMNSRFAEFGASSPENSKLFRIFQAGLVYDNIRDIESTDSNFDLNSLKDPQIFQEKFGKFFGEKSIKDSRITEIIGSLDQRSKVQTEMEKTMREIEKAVVANGGTVSPYVPESKRGTIDKYINPPLDVLGDITANGIHGSVHFVHDVFKSQEGHPIRQTAVGIFMAYMIIKHFIFGLFKKGGWKKLAGALFAGNMYNAFRQGTVDKEKRKWQGYGDKAQSELTQNQSTTNPQKQGETTSAVIQQHTSLTEAESSKLEKTLTKPLGNIPILSLKKVIEMSEKEQKAEWDRLFKAYNIDEKSQEQIREALTDKKNKSALQNTIDGILKHEAIQEIETNDPDKYLVLTLAKALEITQEKNKETNATALLKPLTEDDIFETSLQVIDGHTYTFGPKGEPKEVLYGDLSPEAREALEKFGKHEKKMLHYSWVIQALNVPEISRTFSEKFKQLQESKIKPDEFFKKVNDSLLSEGTYDTNLDTKEVQQLIQLLDRSGESADAELDLLEFIKDEIRQGYLSAGRILATKLIPENEFAENKKLLLARKGDYLSTINTLNISDKQKDKLKEELESMKKYLNSDDYNNQLEALLNQDDGFSALSDAEKGQRKEEARKKMEETSIVQALRYSMAYDAVKNETYDKSNPERVRQAEIFGNIEGFGLFTLASRNKDWGRFAFEFIATEALAIGAGIFTGSAGFWAINSVRGIRLMSWAKRLGTPGRIALGVAGEGLAFHTGYQGVKWGIDKNATVSDTLLNGQAALESIAFIGAARALKALYAHPKITVFDYKTGATGFVGKSTQIAANIAKGGAKLTIDTAVYGATLGTVDVVFGEGEWTEDAIMKGLQAAIIARFMHGTQNFILRQNSRSVPTKKVDSSGNPITKKITVVSLKSKKQMYEYAETKGWGIAKLLEKITPGGTPATAATGPAHKVGKLLVGDVVDAIAKKAEWRTVLWNMIWKNKLHKAIALGFSANGMEQEDLKDPRKIFLILTTGPWRGVFWNSIIDKATTGKDTNAVSVASWGMSGLAEFGKEAYRNVTD